MSAKKLIDFTGQAAGFQQHARFNEAVVEEFIAQLDSTSGYIVWHCPLCGDNGTVHGWEDTLWNRDGGARPGTRPLGARRRRDRRK